MVFAYLPDDVANPTRLDMFAVNHRLRSSRLRACAPPVTDASQPFVSRQSIRFAKSFGKHEPPKPSLPSGPGTCVCIRLIQPPASSASTTRGQSNPSLSARQRNSLKHATLTALKAFWKSLTVSL